MDETYGDLQGRPAYLYRAIDGDGQEDGQVVGACFSERRSAAAAARAFLERAMAETGATPVRVTPDKAKCYPLRPRALP